MALGPLIRHLDPSQIFHGCLFLQKCKIKDSFLDRENNSHLIPHAPSVWIFFSICIKSHGASSPLVWALTSTPASDC